MSRRFFWVGIGLLILVWGFFFLWKMATRDKSYVSTRSMPGATKGFTNDTVALTDLRIKDKIVRLNAVKAGEKVNARYVLYNTGNRPLFIEYVNPDCSCTGYEVSDSVTYPGDSLEIVLKFNSAGKADANFMNAVVKKHTYSLSENDDGLCRPYTLMLKLNDSVFLMKENFDKTVLHLANVKDQRDYSAYVCSYREENGDGASAYTMYDYDFDVIGNKVLLAYRHADRVEVLHISPVLELEPVVIMGGREETIVNNDVYLEVCTNGQDFYCLKCTNKKEGRGNELVVISEKGDIKQRILLDKVLNTIQFDIEGNLVGYVELEQEGVFYKYDKSLI